MDNHLLKNLQSIDKTKKEFFVSQIFSQVSEKYDLMNDIMSLGLHRLWKKEFINFVNPKNNQIILDLASGSGDITKLIKKNCNPQCIVFDSSLEMIIQAKKKLKNFDITYINGHAENLPFRNQFFDKVIVSFGLRNFSDIEKSLREINRVLKKGGDFLCMEFSEINNLLFRKFFDFYSKIIPKYGKLFSNNEHAYKYLIESIKLFPNQIELSKKIRMSGFKDIKVIDIMGGIAAIHMSKK